jgi:hypothetical protein
VVVLGLLDPEDECTKILRTFLYNNKPDALINRIYSVTKLYMFRASSLPIIKEFSTAHSALVSFMQVLMIASKQSQDGTQVPS